MLMDNALELLGITDSNIKITRFSAESVNGEKRRQYQSRHKLKDDIIVYRNDFYPRDLVGVSYKFTGTSVAPGAVIGKVPNVAII